jgi:serine phosphatase RsbU (regulator of sigma subunit)
MTVISQLSRLESAGLIRLVQYEPELEYLFRHVLVQDAAYSTLLATDRKRLHQAVGEAVETLYADRLDELAAMLARHFQRAGDEQHALDYYTRAGDSALASFANQEAESLFRSALDLPCSPPQRVQLLSSLGEALNGQSRHHDAIETWREGIEICRTLDDKDGIARLYSRSARAAWYADDTPGGLRLCQEGLEEVAGTPESADQARLIHEAARAHLFNGNDEEATTLCYQALEMAERLGAVDVQADTLTTIGILPNVDGDTKLGALRKAVQLAESADLHQMAIRAYHNLGVMTGIVEGDMQLARDTFLRAAELSRKAGSISEELISRISVTGHTLTFGEFAAAEAQIAEMEALQAALPDPETASLEIQSNRAALLSMTGRWSEALQLLRKLLPQARQRGNLQMVSNTCDLLAGIQIELVRLGLVEGEDRDAALIEAEAALEDSIELGSLGGMSKVSGLCQLATVHALRGQFAKARHHIVEAQAVAAHQTTAWTEHSLQIAARDLAEAEGRWEEARAATEELAGIQAKLGRRWHWARTLMDWARAHEHLGQPTDLQRAQALMREARRAFAEMGAQVFVEYADERLESLRADMHIRLQAHDKVSRELALAGRIQEGLLPEEVPEIAGWQLAATLEPARETSGDFYDFIPLPDGRLGLVVADVADKGAGAALYMALSRTLIRTYAARFPDQPELVLSSANQRILDETHTGMFVTVFYGVLDPQEGTFRYCNAGHNPPILLQPTGIETLGRTGLALGIVEDTGWESGSARLAPGNALVLYTDGVTEAQAHDGVLFGLDRLQDVVKTQRRADGAPEAQARALQNAVLAAVHEFVGDAPRFDDLTLMVVSRT